MKACSLRNQRNVASFHRVCLAMTGGLVLGVTAAYGADPSLPKISLGHEPNVSVRNEVKHAIDKGVAWLEANQNTNGYWSSGDHPAITGLALIALKTAPGSRDKQTEPPAVTKGYAYLLNCARPDGGIYRKDLPSYNTSIALTALSLANHPEYTPVILKARKFVIGLQVESGDDPFAGGIGYGVKDKNPDLSNMTFALEALRESKRFLADKAQGDTGDLNWQAAIHFIESCQNLPSHNTEAWASDDPHNKGGFIYAPGRSFAGQTNTASGRVAFRSYGSMSYAGLLTYAYADLKRDDPRVTAVLDWLGANYTLDENPSMGQEGLYYYYHMMAKALTIYGADILETKDGRKVNWREDLALKLINLQHADGSWVNENGRWFQKDPALVTPFSLISLNLIYAGL